MDDKVEQQKRHFDQIAGRYQQSRRHRNHLELKRLIWSEFLSDKTALNGRKLVVLEAMCGFADGKSILETATTAEIDYKGFDYSDAVVDALRSECSDIEVWQQDVTQFEARPSFDLVMVLGGLHHVPHAAADVVHRLAGSLKPGGFFLNFEPTHGNRLFQYARERIYRGNSLFDQETERAFHVDELSRFFTDAGLLVRDAMYPGLLSYVLYYNPDAFPWLNVGSPRWVRAAWYADRLLIRNRIGRALSFATLTLWQKPPPAIS